MFFRPALTVSGHCVSIEGVLDRKAAAGATAVYESILPRSPLRFVVADDSSVAAAAPHSRCHPHHRVQDERELGTLGFVSEWSAPYVSIKRQRALDGGPR